MDDFDELISGMRQAMIDALDLCNRLGGREDMKEKILDALKKMDEADSEYLIGVRNCEIDKLLIDEKIDIRSNDELGAD